VGVCSCCSDFIGKIQAFTERCHKSQQLVQFLVSLTEPIEDLSLARLQFGLDNNEQNVQDELPNELVLEVKEEILFRQQTDDDDCAEDVEMEEFPESTIHELAEFNEIAADVVEEHEFVVEQEMPQEEDEEESIDCDKTENKAADCLTLE